MTARGEAQAMVEQGLMTLRGEAPASAAQAGAAQAGAVATSVATSDATLRPAEARATDTMKQALELATRPSLEQLEVVLNAVGRVDSQHCYITKWNRDLRQHQRGAESAGAKLVKYLRGRDEGNLKADFIRLTMPDMPKLGNQGRKKGFQMTVARSHFPEAQRAALEPWLPTPAWQWLNQEAAPAGVLADHRQRAEPAPKGRRTAAAEVKAEEEAEKEAAPAGVSAEAMERQRAEPAPKRRRTAAAEVGAEEEEEARASNRRIADLEAKLEATMQELETTKRKLETTKLNDELQMWFRAEEQTILQGQECFERCFESVSSLQVGRDVESFYREVLFDLDRRERCVDQQDWEVCNRERAIEARERRYRELDAHVYVPPEWEGAPGTIPSESSGSP